MSSAAGRVHGAELQALSLEERISFFYCSSVQDFVGVVDGPSEYLISADDVPYYLQLLESPDREQWLEAEKVLIPFAQGKAAPDQNQTRLLVHLETARSHNEILNNAGALPIYTHHLLRTLQMLKGLNFQYLELDTVERTLSQLNRAITMLYLVVALTPRSRAIERALLDAGVFSPRQVFILHSCLP
ncbi:Striatin-interacting protein 2 [Aphanomyces cochlioides]|nr:Striatin-interacting protein 2 [Aphanomyces cochlioides]